MLHPVADGEADFDRAPTRNLEHEAHRDTATGSDVVSSGRALTWMFFTTPSAPMKIMSSGMSVFCIQNEVSCSVVIVEQHSSVGGELVAEHQPLGPLGAVVGDLDGEGEVALGRVQHEAALGARAGRQ